MDSYILPDGDQITVKEEKVFAEALDEVDMVKDNSHLPAKSRAKYVRVYNHFMAWRAAKRFKSISEPVMMTYFNELAKTSAPTTLWATYSMLRTTINSKHQINIHTFTKLLAYLKKKKVGFISKKSKVLTNEEAARFINEAPDTEFLAIKVALIFGLIGSCKRQELCNISINDIIDKNDMVIVNLPRGKNDKPRTFVVTGHFYDIYKKYANLRPKNIATHRFFLGYKYGKCTGQVIGINTFGGMPRSVARYLELPNPERYTGHTFRKTIGPVLTDMGSSDLRRKRNVEEYMTNSVAADDIQDPLQNETNTSQITMDNTLNPENPSISTAQESQITSDNDDIGDDLENHKPEDSDREVNNIQIINERHIEKESTMTEEIKLDDGRIIHLHLSNCSNVNIYINTNKKD